MNLVEVWFSLIERETIHRGTFTSARDLTTKIRTFIDGWNARCHPLTWTKTADQLLAKRTVKDLTPIPALPRQWPSRRQPHGLLRQQGPGRTTTHAGSRHTLPSSTGSGSENTSNPHEQSAAISRAQSNVNLTAGSSSRRDGFTSTTTNEPSTVDSK